MRKDRVLVVRVGNKVIWKAKQGWSVRIIVVQEDAKLVAFTVDLGDAHIETGFAESVEDLLEKFTTTVELLTSCCNLATCFVLSEVGLLAVCRTVERGQEAVAIHIHTFCAAGAVLGRSLPTTSTIALRWRCHAVEC